jgi:Mg-chelatase subunit ChlD
MGKKLYVSFVLDETGSMSSVHEQTVSGFNEYIQTLKDADNADDVRFTLLRFNSESMHEQYKGVKLSKIEGLSDYRPRAVTPLYDAIGRTIKSLEKTLNGKKRNALVVIQTDGQENDSKEYDREQIFKMIKEKTDKGWTFVFLGADQDAYEAGSRIGVLVSNTLSYAGVDTRKTLNRAAVATAYYADTGATQTEQFFADAEADSEAD